MGFCCFANIWRRRIWLSWRKRWRRRRRGRRRRRRINLLSSISCTQRALHSTTKKGQFWCKSVYCTYISFRVNGAQGKGCSKYGFGGLFRKETFEMCKLYGYELSALCMFALFLSLIATSVLLISKHSFEAIPVQRQGLKYS